MPSNADRQNISGASLIGGGSGLCRSLGQTEPEYPVAIAVAHEGIDTRDDRCGTGCDGPWRIARRRGDRGALLGDFLLAQVSREKRQPTPPSRSALRAVAQR